MKKISFLDLRTLRLSEKAPSRKTIHNNMQNCKKICNHSSPFLYERHKWILPYVKTYCYIESRKSFWKNLKGYYYKIRKRITWKFLVVTCSVYLCKTLKGFTQSEGLSLLSQTVIFMLWHGIVFGCEFFCK